MPAGDLFALFEQTTGIAGDLIAVELDKRPHNMFGKIEQRGIKDMVFEEMDESFLAEQVGDGGTDSFGMLGVETVEFGVDCLTDSGDLIARHIALEDGIAIAAVFGEVVFD